MEDKAQIAEQNQMELPNPEGIASLVEKEAVELLKKPRYI